MIWKMDGIKWIFAALLFVMFVYIQDINQRLNDIKPSVPASSNTSIAKNLDDIRHKINGLEEKNKSSNYQMVDLESTVNMLGIRLNSLNSMHERYGDLDMDGKSYVPVDTILGKLFVSVVEVSPTVSGYNIKMKIGNPNFMTISNLDTTILYGSDYKELQTKILTPLLPGRWNYVEVNIAPATKEEIKKVAISFNPSTVSFGRN